MTDFAQEILEALILGVVQGIAEFLPISSSGHLVILQDLMDSASDRSSNRSNSVQLNVALHLGTLFSILVVNILRWQVVRFFRVWKTDDAAFPDRTDRFQWQRHS